jgi:hypothetical protein
VGETYLLYGGKRRTGVRPLPSVADATFVGVHNQEWLGFGVRGVGDLDRDGLEDLAIGAPATAGYTGALYLFYGQRERFRGVVSTTTADATVVGGQPNGMLGYEVTGGDLDGDGASDLAVTGAPFAAEGAAVPVGVHVFYGGAGERLSGVVPVAAADARLLSADGHSLEVAVRLATGDVTGDGKPDLVVGNGMRQNADTAPHTYVVAGGTRLPALSVLEQTARSTLVGAGSAVAVADVDGDRRPDLVVGDLATDAVHVLRGPVPAGSLAPTRTLRFARGQQSGDAVAVADVTGDRRPDLVVGAPEGQAGRAHVVPGR